MSFKTVGDAYRYCKENGFDISMNDDKLFDIAHSIRNLKTKQDKITRHACAEEVRNIDHTYNTATGDSIVLIDDVFKAIMDTKLD